MNRPQQFVGSATELVEPSGEGPGLNEYHLVILPQCGTHVYVRIFQLSEFNSEMVVGGRIIRRNVILGNEDIKRI